ncbi:MAG: hypothetical protein ACAH59_00465 [Pseudobdellovibrionaceae bacterium]
MKKSIFSLMIISQLCACQMAYVPQARDVKKKPRNSGIIGIPVTQRAEDRQKAEELMKTNCAPQAFSVVDEGEIVVGQETKSSANEINRDDTRRNEGTLMGMSLISGSDSGKETSQSSVTTQLKEWQISYNCASEKQNQAKKTQ